jgi:hypothetical protein
VAWLGVRLVIYVTCADGRRRHGLGFADPDDAVTFAEWGHFCAGRHTYTTDDEIYDTLPTQDDEDRIGLAEPVG